MTRTAAREIAVHFSYEMGYAAGNAEAAINTRFAPEYFETLAQECDLYEESPDEQQLKYIRTVVAGVYEHGPELDSYIQKYSVGWNFSRISMMASAIMRICLYELLYMPEVPRSAAINEAVNIAKKYEDQDVVAFINGILGSFSRAELSN